MVVGVLRPVSVSGRPFATGLLTGVVSESRAPPLTRQRGPW
ncbi:hypothetical protein Ae168Ps1_0829c [Pseudonocardia sp. Ae168_Ps1]|nr:hypothetical protein Ae150APs1_0829c [Pseudonocardia sp. Ae150A_Ps1]OLL78423.1 hypothetical protein Ae168Ps1_0829c [Pseudonocardia sp. Ae168_Ps1]OLL87451.1 hypothetical protein Ae263Ps1_4506 [Pseudonocardia sp. Ae263_Ps1]OLL92520.1 hypothetical protein Ae356Ps1_2417c [Pseudonocardia sp. Ae356_Ps1]